MRSTRTSCDSRGGRSREGPPKGGGVLSWPSPSELESGLGPGSRQIPPALAAQPAPQTGRAGPQRAGARGLCAACVWTGRPGAAPNRPSPEPAGPGQGRGAWRRAGVYPSESILAWPNCPSPLVLGSGCLPLLDDAARRRPRRPLRALTTRCAAAAAPSPLRTLPCCCIARAYKERGSVISSRFRTSA